MASAPPDLTDIHPLKSVLLTPREGTDSKITFPLFSTDRMFHIKMITASSHRLVLEARTEQRLCMRHRDVAEKRLSAERETDADDESN